MRTQTRIEGVSERAVDAVYQLIGRVVVDYLRLRYRRRLRAAAAITAGSVLLAAYLIASRDAAEG